MTKEEIELVIQGVRAFVKEHNIPSLKHAWVLYENCTDSFMRAKYWDAYCSIRDGAYFKPTRYGPMYERRDFMRVRSVYNKQDFQDF